MRTMARLRSHSVAFEQQVSQDRVDRSDDTGTLKLTFDKAPAGAEFRFGRRFIGSEVHCAARHVVLAMPRRAIEILHPDSFIFDSPQFEDDLRSVLPQPGFKIFAAYRSPWWLHARSVSAGRSVTDLPLRQCYYWHTGSGKNLNSVLMATY